MEQFSVNQLATIAGVSVRTLHHYDKIGLLKPSLRSESKYRYYGKAELVRLQQILLYKELDFTLAQITAILDSPGFNVVQALHEHKKELQKRKDRVTQLLQTIDNTIHQLKNQEKMDYNELYKGFNKEQAEAWRKEASEKWGVKTINGSYERILAMTKGDWQALMQKAEDINHALAANMHLAPDDPQILKLIGEHYEMTGRHFNVTPEIYRNMGTMYVGDERFKAYYEKYKPGLAEFLRDAIHAYCDK